jgi:UDP-N-acetylglucosamine:LPS N-acetylglucosamine transferase
MLPQSELTPERLAQAVNRLLSEGGTRGAMAKKARARGKPEAAAEIVSNLLTLIR